jgi:hypothetical protein
MPFLPIVERELRVGSRRHHTYTMRLVIAVPAILIGVFLYIANLQSTAAVLAGRTFLGLAILAMLYCLVAGRRSTADCLSEEKREGTLGLLFLTDLKGHDVVLGKLAATSLSGFYGLLAMFPVLAVPLLMGGVTNGQFWRVVLVLVNTFLFSLAVGLVASAMSRDARQAFGLNFLFLVLIMAPAIAAGLIIYLSPTHILVDQLLYSCPVYSFVLAFDPWYLSQSLHFWSSVGTIHLLTWGLAALASWWAPRSWQDLPVASGKTTATWRERRRDWVYGNAAQRRAFRRRLLDINAFYWHAARARLKPLGVWVFLVFMAGWWWYMMVELQFHWLDETLFLVTVAMVNSILKLWIAIETPQRLADDQKLGALELLLSTPLTVGDILRGQWLALRRQFLFPLLIVVAVELFLMNAAGRSGVPATWSIREVGTTSLILLVADIAAVGWQGIALGLTARNPNQAVIRTVWRVLMLPWVIFIAISVGVNVIAASSSIAPPDWRFFLYLWFWLGVLTDIGFGVPAWWQARLRFRELAMKRLSLVRREH